MNRTPFSIDHIFWAVFSCNLAPLEPPATSRPPTPRAPPSLESPLASSPLSRAPPASSSPPSLRSCGKTNPQGCVATRGRIAFAAAAPTDGTRWWVRGFRTSRSDIPGYTAVRSKAPAAGSAWRQPQQHQQHAQVAASCPERALVQYSQHSPTGQDGGGSALFRPHDLKSVDQYTRTTHCKPLALSRLSLSLSQTRNARACARRAARCLQSQRIMAMG